MSKRCCFYYLKPIRPWGEGWIPDPPQNYQKYLKNSFQQVFDIMCLLVTIYFTKNFRAAATLDLQLQPVNRNSILKISNFLAKSLKNKKWNKISLEEVTTFKTGQIIIFNKRNKMTCKFFAFHFITASWFCHHVVMTVSSLRDTNMRVKQVLNMKILNCFKDKNT